MDIKSNTLIRAVHCTRHQINLIIKKKNFKFKKLLLNQHANEI